MIPPNPVFQFSLPRVAARHPPTPGGGVSDTLVRSVRTSLYTMPQVTIHHNHCRKRRVRSVENSTDGKLDHRRHCHSWRIREFRQRQVRLQAVSPLVENQGIPPPKIRSKAVSPLVGNQGIPPPDSSVTVSIATRGESGNSTTGQFGHRQYHHSWRIREFHHRTVRPKAVSPLVENQRLPPTAINFVTNVLDPTEPQACFPQSASQ